MKGSFRPTKATETAMISTFGRTLKISVYGESHAERIGVTIEGIPDGTRIDADALHRFMARRAPGGCLSTSRAEPDRVIFDHGIENGCVNGKISAFIMNTDVRSSDYDTDIPRPAHADYPAFVKYGGKADMRGGGHFSGRLTAPLCIAGSLCASLLAGHGIRLGAHIASVGEINDLLFDPVNIGTDCFDALATSSFPVLDSVAGEKMCAVITNARTAGDSVGGSVECAVTGMPVGAGTHMFDGVENRVACAVFGIPAVKGIEFGSGFAGSRLRGSQNNDGFRTDGNRVFTETNNHGGILGGMTSGMPVIFRVAFKPTPSIALPQNSVSLSRLENVILSVKGRHDPCVVLRAVPCVEAAAAVALTDILLTEGFIR